MMADPQTLASVRRTYCSK